MYDPGELDQRITFISDSSVSDGMGGDVYTPVDVATVFAKAIAKSGKEKEDYDRINATANYTFVTHYRDDITEAMRIKWLDVEYNIRSIPSLGGRKLYSHFEAERGVPQ